MFYFVIPEMYFLNNAISFNFFFKLKVLPKRRDEKQNASWMGMERENKWICIAPQYFTRSFKELKQFQEVWKKKLETLVEF